ncbi:MAG: sigma 54-interacting transcriptional regulator [Proteobacteria bacterium]|nr:sigma 54-interacting transcriptional regulator [Pseudomonadota bacterium]
MNIKILHLDDDITTLDRFSQMLKNSFQQTGHLVELDSFDNIDPFTQALQSKKKPDVILIDVNIEGENSGVELAKIAREYNPNAVILMVSSTKDTKTIRECLKAGADDFVSKDATSHELQTRVEAALESRKIGDIIDLDNTNATVIAGSTLSAIKQRVSAILNSAINCVYVEGESGTGKEVVANLFAAALPSKMPFVRVNCGAITPSLLMSELFGHTKGSFTGANADKAGLLESADGGWIFLDEVATLPTDAQVSLLRAIDNQAIRRVGSNTEKPIHFRVMSATNEPLQDQVQQGKFRKDLWQRLRETHISLPPLRQRKDEIPELIDLFLTSMRGGPYQLAPTVQDTLIAYDWFEGNIRELRNVLRAMTEKSIGGLLTPKSIPERIWEALEKKPNGFRRAGDKGNSPGVNEIKISWLGHRPDIDRLEQLLFLELIKQEFAKSGPLSLRTLGTAFGIAKSTIATRLKGLVENHVIHQDELNKYLKNASGKN